MILLPLPPGSGRDNLRHLPFLLNLLFCFYRTTKNASSFPKAKKRVGKSMCLKPPTIASFISKSGNVRRCSIVKQTESHTF